MNLGIGDGAVERNDRRLVELGQAIVKRKDLPPVGGLVILCCAVTRSNSRLKMIFTELIPCRRLREMKHPARDHLLVPSRPVLLFQPQQITLAIHARRDARGIQ
jgi:hypothetical protein